MAKNMADRQHKLELVLNKLARLEGQKPATFWMKTKPNTLFSLSELKPAAQLNFDIMLDSFLKAELSFTNPDSNILAIPASPDSLKDILPHYEKYNTEPTQFTKLLRQEDQIYYDNKSGKVETELLDLLKRRQKDIEPCIKQSEYYSYVAKQEHELLENKAGLSTKELMAKWADTVIYSEKYYKYNQERVDKSLPRLESLLMANNGLELLLLKTFLPAGHVLLKMGPSPDPATIRTVIQEYVKPTNKPSNKLRQAILGFEPSCVDYMDIDYLYNAYALPDEGECFGGFTQEYNNFYIYLESLKSSIFPIRFILPKDMDIFYTDGQYHFKRTKPLDTLFTNKYCGTLIIRVPYPERPNKYAYRYVFVFKEGTRYKLTDIFLNRILKMGSLLPTPNVTHVEFSHIINYMHVKPYCIKPAILERYLSKSTNNLYEDMIFFTRHESIPAELLEFLEPAKINVTNTYDKPELVIKYSQGRVYSTPVRKSSLMLKTHHMGGGAGKRLTKKKGLVSKFKMELGTKLILVDKCAGQLFKVFDDIRIYIEAEYGFKSTVKATSYLYPYIFSGEAKFIFAEFKQQPVSHKSMLKYIPITSQFFSYNELYELYLKDKPISSAIYFGQNPAILEVLFYHRYTMENVIFVNKTHVEYPTSQIYNYKTLLFTNKYELPFGDYDPQYICAYSLIEFQSGFNLNYAFQNDINLFIGMLCGLKYTQHGGIFILNIAHIVNKNQADVYLILKKYFQESHLYYPEISNPSKHSGTIALFIGYKGIPDADYQELLEIFNKIRAEYPNGGADLNIIDAKTRKLCLVEKPIENTTHKYIYGYLNTKLTDDAYQEIIQFNNYRYGYQYQFLNKLEYFLQKQSEPPGRIPSQEQIQTSLLYLKKWDIPHFELTAIHKKLTTEFYTLIKPLKFTFTKYKEHDTLYEIIHTENKGAGSLIKKLEPYNNLIHQTGLYIDSRRDFDIQDKTLQTHDYDAVKTQFRFFTPDFPEGKLTRTLEKRYNIENISQAWIKMWEMLSDCEIIRDSDGLTKFNSFHLCEAPGMFILALNHYLHTKTSIKKFNWNAQSLHPSIARIKDTYGLIQKYPNNWHWGPSQTGDIRELKNINYYKKFTTNIQLITSDCGLEWGNPDYEHVAISSLAAIMLLAPVGATMIFKTLAPSDKPLLLDLFYMVYLSFEEIIFYKPLQNLYSREYYIIGKKCKGVSAAHKQILERIIKGGDSRPAKIFDTYIADFMVQMEAFMDQFSVNYSYTIEKQIWYMDNYKSLSTEFKAMARQAIIDKNNDWLATYKVARLPEKHKL